MLKVRLVASRVVVRLMKNEHTAEESRLDEYWVTCLLEQKSDREWDVTVKIEGNPFADSPDKEKKYPTSRITTSVDDVVGAKAEALKLMCKFSRTYHRLKSSDRLHAWGFDWQDGSKFSFR